MQVINQKKVIDALVSSFKKEEKSIGFVPTMGALHDGHLSLVKIALAQCEVVVVSIFVNPTQFDKLEDLEKYPRSIDNDLALLKKCSQEIIVFTPSASEVYGGSVYTETFHFGSLEMYMEGKHRTGHFDGVASVLQLLFDIVKPDKAFFGEKDFQQLQIVKKLVNLLDLNIEIVGCPIAREPNGLAMSSRNMRLTPAERSQAKLIYETLQKVKEYFGTKSVLQISNWAIDQFLNNQEIKLEYFEIVDEETLKSVTTFEKGKNYRAFVAAYIREVRLIDNIPLN